MVIQVGWWVLPLAITCAAFIASWAATEPNQRGMMAWLVALLFGGLALIVSLIAWLIWAVLT